MKRVLIVTTALTLAGAAPAFAQSAEAPAAQPAATPAEPSTNAMVNLIRLLVQQGTITQANGDALLRQAQAEATQARATSGELPAAAPGTIRVPYVPETVRNQIRDEIKADVMRQAAFEGWAAPDQQTPAWVRNITINGDIRVRSQSDLFSADNANDIVDYARINATSGGFDFIKNAGNVPIVNTLQDRYNRLKLRARLGLTANVGKFVTAGFRVATGDDNSPISTNQNLGGGLTKRNIWLDQAYVKLTPVEWANATFGRFANPFRSTELLFDSDINFDGAVVGVDAKPFLPDAAHLGLRLGAFPLDFGSSDFPTTSITKRSVPEKWLFSGQIEGGYDFGGVEVRAGAAYHWFRNIQGQLSAPCLFNGANVKLANGANDPDECSTDYTRAGGLRKGNTLFFIRNTQVPLGETQKATEKQFLGLVYRYKILDLTGSVSFPIGGFKGIIEGDYVRNLAFKRSDECRFGIGVSPVTNVITTQAGNDNACSATDPASVSSGNQGYYVRVGLGFPKPKRWGEWNVAASYRYLESDAVLDSLTDSDFHLGGTNSKGYTVSGTIGLFDGVSLTGRWMSANEISGRPLSIDVFQVDLSAEF